MEHIKTKGDQIEIIQKSAIQFHEQMYEIADLLDLELIEMFSTEDEESDGPILRKPLPEIRTRIKLEADVIVENLQKSEYLKARKQIFALKQILDTANEEETKVEMTTALDKLNSEIETYLKILPSEEQLELNLDDPNKT